ncbi:MAG: hypothetical protein HY903_14335 [Deltaproteobacteria bacterium]|nr:hypothetical protein [Deltaproteobacteria bacterium]
MGAFLESFRSVLDPTWQFYTPFGMREDASRFTFETAPFADHAAEACSPPAIGSWLRAAAELLFDYDQLLAHEWRQRTWTRLIDAEIGALRQGGDQGSADAADHEMGAVRPRLQAPWAKETALLDPLELIKALPAESCRRLRHRFERRRRRDENAFCDQLSLLVTLAPTRQADVRRRLSLAEIQGCLLYGDDVYAFDLALRDERGLLLVFASADPADTAVTARLVPDRTSFRDERGRVVTIDKRGQVVHESTSIGCLRPPPVSALAAAVAQVQAGGHSPLPAPITLRRYPRGVQAAIRAREQDSEALRVLARAPIIVQVRDFDKPVPLGVVRACAGGTGDQPLTIMPNRFGTAFDFSHIIFDGVWAITMADRLTRRAQELFRGEAASRTATPVPVKRLDLSGVLVTDRAERAPRVPAVAYGETTAVDLDTMRALRRRLTDRGIALSAGDILLLGLFLHHRRHAFGAEAETGLAALEAAAAHAVVETIRRTRADERLGVPVPILFMDAAPVDPRQRLFMATWHTVPDDALYAVLEGSAPTSAASVATALAAFARAAEKFRSQLAAGVSPTFAAIGPLKTCPGPFRNAAHRLPLRSAAVRRGVIGDQLFSNLGQMAPGSAITRVSGARGDVGDRGIILTTLTNCRRELFISIRDFRPYVGELCDLGHPDAATVLAQDYVDGYASTTNALVKRLAEILGTSAVAAAAPQRQST